MAKTKIYETAEQQSSCVLVGIITDKQQELLAREYIAELAFLADTAGVKTDKVFLQRMSSPVGATFVGQGKVEEIKAHLEENPEIDLVIFDDELSPKQQRNLENAFKKRVLDRPTLILDIFALRARSAYAQTQVELAQYQYLLPRLSGMWTHLERQKGGIGMRGPGETQIETDRRIIRTRIAKLKEKLGTIDRQMATQRSNRGDWVRVALVGYTNVGKSTLMNLLSKSDVFAENKLFATLDTTVRKVVWENVPFLLADTVGFIRKLPHQLVESFKSTLDEVREADILLHVVDLSHPNFEDQFLVVQRTLNEINCQASAHLVVFNKIDAYDARPREDYEHIPGGKPHYTLQELENSWMKKMDAEAHCVFISAKDKQNIEQLRTLMLAEILKIHKVRYPNYLSAGDTFNV
jgi:GTPase